MENGTEKINIGKTYVLLRDFIESPNIRHNFGTEVLVTGYGPPGSGLIKVRVNHPDITNEFMVPESILL